MGAVGIGLVNAAGAAVGVTGIPGPVTDSNWDGWLYHRYFQFSTQVATAVGFSTSSHEIEIDSKAMRKVKSDDALFMMFENQHPTHAFFESFGVRFLTKAG